MQIHNCLFLTIHVCIFMIYEVMVMCIAVVLMYGRKAFIPITMPG